MVIRDRASTSSSDNRPHHVPDRATGSGGVGSKTGPSTRTQKYVRANPGSVRREEVDWESEAQYWSEDTVAAFLKRGGKITKLNPRVARGATKKKTIRLR